MKPGIYAYIDEIQQALKEDILRLGGAGNGAGSGGDTLIGTIVSYFGPMGGANSKHPVDQSTGRADTSYALCDGEAYYSERVQKLLMTPDLRGRFIMGPTKEFPAQTTGGSAVSQGPRKVEGTTLTIAQLAPHTHNEIFGQVRLATGNLGSSVALTKSIQFNDHVQVTVSSGGGEVHTHTISEEDSVVDIVPPFYALCYLMKL